MTELEIGAWSPSWLSHWRILGCKKKVIFIVIPLTSSTPLAGFFILAFFGRQRRVCVSQTREGRVLTFLRKKALRLWTAEFAAMVLYNVLTGIPNILIETAVVGNTPEQWLFIHWLLFNPPKFILARFVQAPFADELRRRFAPIDDHSLRRKAVDTIALACYQIPIYLLASHFGGRSNQELVWLFWLSLSEHAIAGQFHGRLRDGAKKFFANGTTTASAALEPTVGD